MNQPAAMKGIGLSGPRVATIPELTPEQRRQRSAVANLVSAGLAQNELEQAVMTNFGLTLEASRLLIANTLEEMLSESNSRRPYKKAMAEQRLYRHIAAAAKRNAWGAVANLEAQLSRIQGTEEPVEQRVTIDARLQSATLQVLGGMSSEAVAELIAEELGRR